MSRTFTPDETIKLKQLINEGLTVLQEVEALNGGLSDTIKAIAEELEIKPSVLRRAIKIAHKQRLHETNEENSVLNDILDAVGKGN